MKTITSVRHSLVPAEGIIVPTQKRPAEIISFSTGQLLGGGEAVNRLLANESANEFKFTLFSDDFIQLQLTIAQALKLPIATGDFDRKYGTFRNKETVVKCVEALGKLSALCKKFGNPSTLFAEIEKLGKGERPEALYARIVWLAQQIANTSQTFSLSLMQLYKMLKDLPDAEVRYEALKAVLSGPRGLLTKSQKMVDETTALRNAILAYREEMKSVKAPIDHYFGTASEVYVEAAEKDRDIKGRIATAQAELIAARDEYVKYCAAAASSSVGLFVITGGIAWPLSAVAGGVLGALAETARKRANALEEEIRLLGEETKLKVALLSDVLGLGTATHAVEARLTKVYDGLGQIGGVWSNVASQFTAIVHDTSPEELKNLDAFNAAIGITTARDTWLLIAQTTSAFTAKAFVDFKP